MLAPKVKAIWHRTSQAVEACIEHVHRAIDLYRGELLEGFSLDDSLPFEEWLLFQRERFHRLAVSTLRSLATCHAWRDEHGQVLCCARRHVALEPWRKEAHRQVMHAWASTGRRNAALAHYQTCRRLLQSESGVEPEEETMQLYHRIREGGALLPFVALSRHNLPAPLTPFVGRVAELAQVKARLRDPNCRLLTLVGPGGMGKTRLALEAGRDLLYADLGGLGADHTHLPLRAWHAVGHHAGCSLDADADAGRNRG